MRKNLRAYRIGKKRRQNCGQETEITEYLNARNINVRFSDGTEIQHRSYKEFRRGHINNPNIKQKRIPKNNQIEKRIGERRIQNCGLEAEIIDYLNTNDITVRFSNGIEIKHKCYGDFVKGHICPPSERNNKSKRIHEKQIQNCGLEAEIIGYQMAKDMVIMFSDNIIVNNKDYQSFKEKTAGHPTISQHFSRFIGTIYPNDKSKIYHTNVQGIAYTINDTYYYFCHCPICNAHEIWTFNEIKNHKCNRRLVKERKELAQAYIEMIQSTQ